VDVEYKIKEQISNIKVKSQKDVNDVRDECVSVRDDDENDG